MTLTKTLNDLDPGKIYQVSKQAYNTINRVLRGNLTAYAFAKIEDGKGLIKPATKGDNKFIVGLMNQLKIQYIMK